MDTPFGKGELRINALLAAEALRVGKVAIDRSFGLNFPDHLTQNWIDDLVLQGHMVAPIWSDYALVRERPDIWGMAFHTVNNLENHIVLVADDSLVVSSDDRVQMLITSTPVADSESIHYQIGFHCFAVTSETLFYPLAFQELAIIYGLIAYPDSTLIDELGLWQTGKNAIEFIEHKERTRPVFVQRKPTNLPTAAKEFQRAAKQVFSGFGPVFVNDDLFNRYRHLLSDRKFGLIGIAPGGEVFALERDRQLVPANFPILVGNCEITPSSLSSLNREIEAAALSFWKPAATRLPSIEVLHEGGRLFKGRVDELLERVAPPSAPMALQEEPSAVRVDRSPPSGTHAQSFEKARPLSLDADGYPIETPDLSLWSGLMLGDRLVIAPRARRALIKSQHPTPRRIAEALEILAGPKLRGYLGDTDTVSDVEAGLLRLHMRDGFSNAERLKGQTGEDYMIELGGRRLLLERHLRSNSSGFNDPRMIRIYYVFDKLLQKIVVGWLPGHLRTSQS